MSDEVFTAYKKGPHLSRDGRSGEVELEMAINPDIASQIDAKNNWVEPGEITQDKKDDLMEIAARGLSELILFCFKGQRMDRRGKGLRTAIRRFVAVAWMLKSHVIVDEDDDPLSLDRLSQLPQVRCTRCTLSLLAQEFGRAWGFRVRVQKRESTKVNYARSAKHGWKKRRLREKKERDLNLNAPGQGDSCRPRKKPVLRRH